MMLAAVAIIFLALILISMPIVFALAVAGIAGLWLGGYPMQQLSSALVSGSQITRSRLCDVRCLMETCGR